MLSKEIEKIEAMTDEAAKNYIVKEFFEKDISAVSTTPEYAKNLDLKILKQQLENAKTEEAKQTKLKDIDELNKLSLDEYKKQQIANLEKAKEKILKKTPADTKTEQLDNLRAHLNTLKQSEAASAEKDKMKDDANKAPNS